MTGPTYFRFDEVFDVDEYLYFYDDTLRAEDTPRQVDFLERALGLEPGATVLDLGCGHGRHANELARRGYRPVGVDVVPGFLEVARAEAARDGLAVDFVESDVRALALEGRIDHAVCLFDAFGFLDDEGNAAFLRAVHASLRPGGGLLLDVRNRDWIVRSILPVTVLDKGDDLMIDRHVFDVETGRLVDRRTYVRGGRVRHVSFSVRLFSCTELTALLASTGFTVERVWGGWDGAPLSLGKNRMLLLARRDLAATGTPSPAG
jgi:SAM-dependent methyltransferase